MKLYHYPTCSTCKQAIKFLRERGADAQLINIVEQTPSAQELEQMLAIYNGNIKKLFNTSGIQYRELAIKDRLPALSPQQAIELLVNNGMLIKRPFLLLGGNSQVKGAVGFKPEEWSELLV
jgi:arsenate reductase